MAHAFAAADAVVADRIADTACFMAAAIGDRAMGLTIDGGATHP